MLRKAIKTVKLHETKNIRHSWATFQVRRSDRLKISQTHDYTDVLLS